MKKFVDSKPLDSLFSLEGLPFKKKCKGSFFHNKRWKNAKALAQLALDCEPNCTCENILAAYLRYEPANLTGVSHLNLIFCRLFDWSAFEFFIPKSKILRYYRFPRTVNHVVSIHVFTNVFFIGEIYWSKDRAALFFGLYFWLYP